MKTISKTKKVAKTALTDAEQVAKWLSDLVDGNREERDLFFSVLGNIYGPEQMVEWTVDEIFSGMTEEDTVAIKSREDFVKYLHEIF